MIKGRGFVNLGSGLGFFFEALEEGTQSAPPDSDDEKEAEEELGV